MKTNKYTQRVRPLIRLLTILGLAAWTNAMVWGSVSAAERKAKDEGSRSPVQVLDTSDLDSIGTIEDLQNILKSAPGIKAKGPGNDTSRIQGVTSETWPNYKNPEDFGNQTPPGIEELSDKGLSPELMTNMAQFLGFILFQGWNSPLYHNVLRSPVTPFAATSLTPQVVSQPEHVTALQAKFLHYMFYGPLLMEVLRLNYRYTLPGYLQSQATTDQNGPAYIGMAAPIVRMALMRLVIYAIATNQPPYAIALAIYQKTNNIFLAAEAIALTFAMYKLALWGGEPPTARIADRIVGAALLSTWFVILNNLQAIAYRDAALAMAHTVLLLNWNVLQAHTVAMLALGMWNRATIEDRSYVTSALRFTTVREFVADGRRVRVQVDQTYLFRSRKNVAPYVMVAKLFQLATIAAFSDPSRIFEEDVKPNDPLYMKKGGGQKVAAGVRKGLGFLLGAVGAPVAVEDNLANDQWGLHSVGFKPRGTPSSAWDVADGSQMNVVVAVIDSGLDTAHPDGPQYLWTNEDEIPGNGVDDDANGYVDDVHGWNFVAENNNIQDDFGHGTFVTGIIAAKRNNGEGIAGINPGAQIMTLKILNERGSTKSLAVYRAIRYAVDNGARVLNLSVGGRGLSPLEQIGINYAYTMGCIVVVAAGNESGNIAEFGLPGARRSFSVASMNMDNTRRDASNKGLNVALAAPGESVYSLTAEFEGDRDHRVIPLLAKGYHRLNGTSFAAPFVAATASLIWTKHPHLDQRQVEDMILASALDIHDPGWDMPTGVGKLDAFAALNQDPDKVLVPRITEFFVNKVKRKIASVDIYGVVRGNLQSFRVEVGRGKEPKKWQQVYGPSTTVVDHDLICRIDGQYFAKGSKWKVRLIATDNQGQTRTREILVSKK